MSDQHTDEVQTLQNGQDLMNRDGNQTNYAHPDVISALQFWRDLGAKHKVIAGVPEAWTYVEQISKVEAYRPPARFADAVKGLHLYGAKVLRPNALACMVASKS